MASGSDDILITVRIVGDGSVGGPPGPPPDPIPPPLPGGDGGGGGGGGGAGGGGSVRDRWWWLNLIPGTGGRVRETGRVLQRLGVSPTGGMLGLGAALASLVMTARVLTRTYRAHIQAIDNLTQRYAASPALQALEDISALRVQIARIQRGQEIAPRLAPLIARRTQQQIQIEDAMAAVNEAAAVVTGPVFQDIATTSTLLSQVLQQYLGDATGRLQLRRLGNALHAHFGTEAILAVGRGIIRFFAREELKEADMAKEKFADFQDLLWVLSPDNPVNRPGRNNARGTFGDVPPRPREENI